MKKLHSSDDSGSVDLIHIKGFEHSHKIKFPTAYVDLISSFNNLRPVESSFDFFHFSQNRKNSNDMYFLGFGHDVPDYDNIHLSQNHDYGTNGIIVFGACPNGDYICFDYRHNPNENNPKVVLMFHDEYDVDNKMLIYCLADSFEDFVDMLYEYEDE